MSMDYSQLSDEQKLFIKKALDGYHVLVNACIGSGKTTAIQVLCELFSSEKTILYLTYNKLLKLDAQAKIICQNKRVTVTNYHGFCFRELARVGIRCGLSEIIQVYNDRRPKTDHYDVLILDEYQDIESELGVMLKHVKSCNPGIQIIAVGDIDQKIYDKTRIDAMRFITEFISGDCYRMEFTKCFRLSSDFAAYLGDIWHKTIIGVNDECEVVRKSFRDALAILADADPGDILCVGSNTGGRTKMMNRLEELYPDKFNKYTVWSKVSEQDGGATSPRPDCAIFTTYDGCKGMERDICVVFDWTESYWDVRISKPNTRYEILRNIFCVAASRGKKLIVFVDYAGEPALSKETLMDADVKQARLDDVVVSKMFDFKYVEDVEAAYGKLSVLCIAERGCVINAPASDGLIDLSFCVGVYQEAAYFKNCDIDTYIKAYFDDNPDDDYLKIDYENLSLDAKVLYLASLETRQQRYINQASLPFISDKIKTEIEDRLAAVFPEDADAQMPCHIPFSVDGNLVFTANGFADVIMNDIVYELKFVTELQHVHFLQCAVYMIGRGLQNGILFNVRDGSMFSISIPDRHAFMDCVTRAITKGRIDHYDGMSLVVGHQARSGSCRETVAAFCSQHQDECQQVFQMMMDARQSGKSFGMARVERSFRDLNLSLPVSNKTFVKYWTKCMAEYTKKG